MSKNKFTDFYLVVNLDERGEYSASVNDPNDTAVFEIESAEQVREMQEDGFLKDKPDEDLDRLTDYLMSINILPNGSQIYSQDEFDSKIRDQYKDGEDEMGKGGEVMSVRIGQPYHRVLVKAKITLCKNPDKKYSDFDKFKEGHIDTYNRTHDGKGGKEDWDSTFGNYDSLPSIKSGDLILNGREDKSGGMIAVQLIDIDARWSGSGLKIYDNQSLFNRVDIVGKLPTGVVVEEDIEDKHRKYPAEKKESKPEVQSTTKITLSWSIFKQNGIDLTKYLRCNVGRDDESECDYGTVQRKVSQDKAHLSPIIIKMGLNSLVEKKGYDNDMKPKYNLDKFAGYIHDKFGKGASYPSQRKNNYKSGGNVTSNPMKDFMNYYAQHGAIITGGSYFNDGTSMGNGGEVQPNFTKVKNLFYEHFNPTVSNSYKVNSQTAHILMEVVFTPSLRESFHERSKRFSSDFKKWLDIVDIRATGALIDALVKDNAKGIPSWMKNKEYAIDYNDKGALDLIRTDEEMGAGGKVGNKKGKGKKKNTVSKKVKPVSEPKNKVEEEEDSEDKPVDKSNMDWNEIALLELKEHESDDDIEEVRSIDNGGFEAESGNSSWMVFENEDSARDKAIAQVKQDLEDSPENFTKSWLNEFIYITDTDKRIIAGEQADSEVDGMSDDELIEEADMDSDKSELEEKISNLETEISELEEGEEDNSDEITAKEKEKSELESDLENLPEKAKEKVQSDRADKIEGELDDPIDYFVEQQGIYSTEELLKQSFIRIDEDKASKDAVDTDGIAHFLSSYDGNQIDLPSGAVAYRTN